MSHDTIKITELPVGTWTEPYKAFLETLMEDKDKKVKKKKQEATKYAPAIKVFLFFLLNNSVS